MIYLIGTPVFALLALIQTSVLSYSFFLDGRVDLVLLAVIGWGLTGRSTETIAFAFIGGLFLDFFTALPFGINAIALVAVALLITSFEGRIWEANLLTPLAIALVASLAYHILILGAVFLAGREVDLPFAFRRVIFPSTFLNLILAIPLSQVAASLANRFFPPEVEI
jgi:rod shape-determining protein MreD